MKTRRRRPLFGFGPQADFNDVSQVVASVDQGGLGMPNRDFYLGEDEKSKVHSREVRTLIISLLKLDGAGATEAAQDATTILRVETTIGAGADG